MDSYKIKWTQTAVSDLTECVRFVLNVSKEAAKKLKIEIQESINSLSFFPEKNPILDMPKSFKIVIRKQVISKRYIALYSVEDDSIIIYRILDTRRKFGPLL